MKFTESYEVILEMKHADGQTDDLSIIHVLLVLYAKNSRTRLYIRLYVMSGEIILYIFAHFLSLGLHSWNLTCNFRVQEDGNCSVY
jgi:hypothetical protein